jgi:hypothetical protein
MAELIPKDNIAQILKSSIPDAEWLLGRIESEQGWLRFPPYLSRLISNLRIENYPLLYASEMAIVAMLLRGFMTTEEIQTLGAELDAASPGERGEFVLELVKDLDEVVECIDIPKTPEQQAQARRLFEALSPEDQQEATRVAQHFFCFFLASFYQNLSVMVHGEKLTSLVVQAKAGNDTAFVKAIQIDKRILTADPFFSERFNRAQMESDSNFCDGLAYRLKAAPYRGKIRHKSLWLAFSVFESAQLLDALTYREILEICDEAGVGGFDNRIQSEKDLGNRLRAYREFQKRGIVTTS